MFRDVEMNFVSMQYGRVISVNESLHHILYYKKMNRYILQKIVQMYIAGRNSPLINVVSDHSISAFSFTGML